MVFPQYFSFFGFLNGGGGTPLKVGYYLKFAIVCAAECSRLWTCCRHKETYWNPVPEASSGKQSRRLA